MTTLRGLLESADPFRHESGLTDEQRVRLRQAIVAGAQRAEAPSRPVRRLVPMGMLIALTSMIAVAVVTVSLLWPHGSAIVQAAVRFEVRLAEDQPGPGLRAARVASSNRTLYLHPEVIVTNDDIERSGVISGDTPLHFWIDVRLSPAGADKMRQATNGHIGRPVAILVDGEVVAAPTVRSAIGGAALISGDFSRSEAERIVRGMMIAAP